MAQTPYPVNTELTALSIAYSNSDDMLIADDVLPRIPKSKQFKWQEYSRDAGYTIPQTLLGRKSEAREVEFQSIERNGATLDYGLADYVPEDDMAIFRKMPKAPGVMDPVQVATIMTTRLLKLDRERRVANLLTTPATFGANTVLVGAPQQFSNYTNSDPALQILNIMDSMLVRPNTLVVSQETFTALRRHPKLVSAIYPVSQLGNGSLSAAQVAESLGLQYIRIGASRINTAAIGLPANLVRTWGKSAVLLNVNKELAMTDMPTFGFTADFGGRKVQSWFEPKRGVDGATGIKVTDQVNEVIVSTDAGYLLQNVIP